MGRRDPDGIWGAPQDAEIMLVGEQPRVGKTVKAAGSSNWQGLILDKALREAGVERKRVHVTNAVKHFKFQSLGFNKARTLARSRYAGVGYSRGLRRSPPRLTVALGATAAQG
jgi:uracil-DNA glycosylase